MIRYESGSSTYFASQSQSSRKLAQKWHPDNFQDEDEKKKAEKKFMDIAAAKEVLTDQGRLFRRVIILQNQKKKPIPKLLAKLVHLQKCAKSMTAERIRSTQSRRTEAEDPSTVTLSTVTLSAVVADHFSSNFTSTEGRLFEQFC